MKSEGLAANFLQTLFVSGGRKKRDKQTEVIKKKYKTKRNSFTPAIKLESTLTERKKEIKPEKLLKTNRVRVNPCVCVKERERERVCVHVCV